MRFEKDLIKIVPELEMKKAKEQMKMDKMRIKRSKEMIVSADKTDNHYLIPVNDYKKMLLDNILKDYRKTTMNISSSKELFLQEAPYYQTAPQWDHPARNCTNWL